MKIAYIAHPVAGDVKGNIAKILAIVRRINLEEPNVVPFAPYITDIQAMHDVIPFERDRGMTNNFHLLSCGFIDEVRLYGDRISKGMQKEIELAKRLGIPVVAMTEQTRATLKSLNDQRNI